MTAGELTAWAAKLPAYYRRILPEKAVVARKRGRQMVQLWIHHLDGQFGTACFRCQFYNWREDETCTW